MRLYCCPSYLCLYCGGALPALLCFFMTDVSALSAVRLSPTSVVRFRFGFLCRDALRALLCRISLCLRVALSLCCPWIMALRSIASALSAVRLLPTSVARFRFGFLCRDGTCFVSCLLVLSVTARTHDRLFCVYSHRPPYDRMAVCSRARLSPLRSCARRQIRICRRAGFIVVPFTLSDGRSFPARPNDIQDPANSDGRSRPARSNDIRDPAKMSCTACAALLALRVAERERQLLTDRFYHVALHMSIGNFPVDVSAR